MRRIQRRRHLLDDRDGPFRGEWPVGFGQHGSEILAVDQPHVEVELAVDLAVAVNGNDVRLAQARRGVRLAAEALLEDRVAGEVGGQDLECDDSVGDGVVRPEYLAHSAPTEQF